MFFDFSCLLWSCLPILVVNWTQSISVSVDVISFIIYFVWTRSFNYQLRVWWHCHPHPHPTLRRTQQIWLWRPKTFHLLRWRRPSAVDFRERQKIRKKISHEKKEPHNRPSSLLLFVLLVGLSAILLCLSSLSSLPPPSSSSFFLFSPSSSSPSDWRETTCAILVTWRVHLRHYSPIFPTTPLSSSLKFGNWFSFSFSDDVIVRVRWCAGSHRKCVSHRSATTVVTRFFLFLLLLLLPVAAAVVVVVVVCVHRRVFPGNFFIICWPLIWTPDRGFRLVSFFCFAVHLRALLRVKILKIRWSFLFTVYPRNPLPRLLVIFFSLLTKLPSSKSKYLDAEPLEEKLGTTKGH